MDTYGREGKSSGHYDQGSIDGRQQAAYLVARSYPGDRVLGGVLEVEAAIPRCGGHEVERVTGAWEVDKIIVDG
jgi:hypothetical protein